MTAASSFHDEPQPTEPAREITPGADIPRPPKGYQTCNVHDGRQDLWAKGARRQVNHLVAVPTSGPTLCGLTRFGKDADLPGWSMGGGVSGPSIVQAPCPACWQAVEAQ